MTYEEIDELTEREIGLVRKSIDYRMWQEGRRCPFCGQNPYEYVNVEVGGGKTATMVGDVICCGWGIGLFKHKDPEMLERAEKIFEEVDKDPLSTIRREREEAKRRIAEKRAARTREKELRETLPYGTW